MKHQKTRSEIEDKYKWDLTRIYKTNEDFDKDVILLKEKIEEVKNYEGKLFESSKTYESYLRLDDELDCLFNKLSSYAFLKMSEDGTNVDNQRMNTIVSDLYNKYSNASAFYSEEFYSTDYNKIKKLLQESDYLKEHTLAVDRFNRYREHSLSKENQIIATTLGKTLNSSSDIFDMLTEAEMKFPTIKDEKGNDVELTESNYSTFSTSKVRSVRESAFKALYKTYESFKNTIALTYTTTVDANISNNKIHNFNDVREASLFSDNIDVKVYDNLINSVHNKLPALYKYYELKRKMLNLDEIHLYDLYAKVIQDSEKEYSYEEAVDIVLKALAPLGEEYTSIAKNIFDSKLVDVYNSVGKTTGAFSAGNYDTDAYILLNYENKFHDVSTIAHELGHSMHSTYSRKNNLRQYADYRIFVAEVASTTNELILADYFLKNSKDDKEKLMILNNLLDNYKATIYRQTMFAEFEREMFKRRHNDEVLTNENMSEYYYDLNKLYFGENVVVDEEIKYEWSRIPHFYRPFYVYKYATSMSAASVIADKIISGDTEFRDKYIEFLSMGDRKFPIDELKTLGIDMTSEEVVNNALDKFEKLTIEFKNIYNKQKEVN